jgi:hypothetical protein
MVWHLSKKKKARAKAKRSMAQYVECLPNKWKALNSIPSTTKRKKKLKEKTKELWPKVSRDKVFATIILFIMETYYVYSKGRFWTEIA